MASMTFHLKAGDLVPPIVTVCTDGGGEPVDLTTADEVRFHLASPTAIDAVADIIDPAGGVVRYQWQPGDTDEVGVFRADFEVIAADQPTSFPNDGYITVVIHRSLAATGS